jgi:TP901 family phage tail tape measure protein
MATLVIQIRGEQAERMAKRLQKEIRKVGDEATKTEAKTAKTGTAAAFAGSQFKTMALGIASSIAGVIALRKALDEIRDSVRVFTEFEAGMTKINTLVGISQQQLKEWTPTLQEIAQETGKTSSEMADALFFVTSAGLRGSEAIDALRASAQGSALGLGEASQIADAATSVMNAYGAEVYSATEATNILALAIRAGKLEASQLAPVMGRLVPTAVNLGLSFEDVAGVMAVMSRTGLDAAEASTSLNSIMSLMAKGGTKDAVDILASVNLSMGDLRATAAGPGGLIAAIRQLAEATKDLDDEALARIVPNIRAFRGVMNVLGQDAATVDDVMRQVASGVDVLGEGMKVWGETAEAAFNRFKSAADSLKIAVGEEIVDDVTALTEALTEIVEKRDEIVGAITAIRLAYEWLSGVKFAELFVTGSLWVDLLGPTDEERAEAKAKREAAVAEIEGLADKVEAALSGGAQALAYDADAALKDVVAGYKTWGGEAEALVSFLEKQDLSGVYGEILQELILIVDTTGDWGASMETVAQKVERLRKQARLDKLAIDLKAAKEHLREMPRLLQDALAEMRELRREAEQMTANIDEGIGALTDRFTDRGPQGFDLSQLDADLQDSLSKAVENAFSDPSVFGNLDDAIIRSGSLENAIGIVTQGVIESGTEAAAEPQRIKKVGENIGSIFAGTISSALVMALQGQDWEAVGSSIGGAIGTAIGSAYGPGGAAAGGAIGSLVGGLFGSLFDDDSAEKAQEMADAFERINDMVRKSMPSIRQDVISTFETIQELFAEINQYGMLIGETMAAVGRELENLRNRILGITPEDFGDRLRAAQEFNATLTNMADTMVQTSDALAGGPIGSGADRPGSGTITGGGGPGEDWDNNVLLWMSHTTEVVGQAVGDGIANVDTEGLALQVTNATTEVMSGIGDAVDTAAEAIDIGAFLDQIIAEAQGADGAAALASLRATFDELTSAIRGLGLGAEATAEALKEVNAIERQRIKQLQADALLPLLQMMQQFGVFENEARREQAKLMRFQARLELRVIEAQLEALGVMDATIRKWIDALEQAIADFDFSSQLPEINVNVPDVALPDGPLDVEVGNVVDTNPLPEDPGKTPTQKWWESIVSGTQDLVAKYLYSPLEQQLRAVNKEFEKFLRPGVAAQLQKRNPELYAQLVEAYEEAMRQALEKAYKPLIDLRDSLTDYGLSQSQSFSGIQSEFFDLAGQVQGGDLEQIEALARAGGDYKAAIEAMFGGTRQGRLLIEQMEEMLTDLIDEGLEDPNLEELTQQTDYLEDIRDLMLGQDPMIVFDENGDLHQLRLTTEDAATYARDQRERTLTILQDTQTTTHSHLVELIQEVRQMRLTQIRIAAESRQRPERAEFPERTVGDLT